MGLEAFLVVLSFLAGGFDRALEAALGGAR